MKLELKHLAPYLPYDLQTCYINSNKEAIKTKLTPQNIVAILVSDLDKPILKPLSNLMVEMNLKTHEFWIVEELRKISDGSLVEEEWIDHMIDFHNKIHEVDFKQCPYRFVEFLFSEHWDLFDLIPNELAFDINSLNL